MGSAERLRDITNLSSAKGICSHIFRHNGQLLLAPFKFRLLFKCKIR